MSRLRSDKYRFALVPVIVMMSAVALFVGGNTKVIASRYPDNDTTKFCDKGKNCTYCGESSGVYVMMSLSQDDSAYSLELLTGDWQYYSSAGKYVVSDDMIIFDEREHDKLIVDFPRDTITLVPGTKPFARLPHCRLLHYDSVEMYMPDRQQTLMLKRRTW